jgi:predicted Zn-dependent protease
MSLLYRVVRDTVVGAVVGLVIVYGVVVSNLPKYKITNDEVKSLYNKLLAQTGQSQDRLPLEIVESNVVNAYTDGKKVYVYRGILDYVDNEDQLALVLSHEIAHNMLRHLANKNFMSSSLEVSIAEANADKLGAYYLMKAGYSLCQAREIWKKFQAEEGDYLGGDHPTYIYRYSQLDMGCSK